MMTFERHQSSQSHDGPSPSCSRTPSPSPTFHGEISSSHGLPTYAPPSILPSDYSVPSCIDHTSQFFQILTSPYHPRAPLEPWVRSTPRQEDAQRSAAMVDWGNPDDDFAHCHSAAPQEGSSSSRPAVGGNLVTDLPIYVPHGPWAWTAGEDIQQTETLLSLRQGSMCSAHIQTGVIAGRKVTFISRQWNLDKQAEWIGFQSELALYKSEQYLKPLQGVVVPRIIGVHILPGAISIAMELPHQSFWIEASPTMPDILKERAMKGLEMLHSRGILHGDIELRHVLIGGDGAVTFIDFQLSRATTPNESIGLEKAEDEEFRFEKRMLAFKLDLHGARAHENQKTEAFVQRTRRNQRRNELWKHRSKGARTGHISPYEKEPEDEKIVPPVHPHDLQDTWIKNSDALPARIVVPGQSEEEVKAAIQTFLESLDEPQSDECISKPLPSIESKDPGEPGTGSLTSFITPDLPSSLAHAPLPPSLKRKRSAAPSPSPHGSLASLDTPPMKRIRHETKSSPSAGSSYNKDPLPALRWTNPRDRVHMWYSDLPEDAEVSTPPVRVRPLSETATRIREQNIAICREQGLPHPELVERGEVVPTNAQRYRLLLRKRRGVARGNLLRERERDGYSPYVHHIEKSHQRERYLGLKHLKNAYIATYAGAPNLSGIPMDVENPTLVALLHMNERSDTPEGPRILQQGEYEQIQNSRKQAIILTPFRKLLKRGREDDAEESYMPAENSPNPAVPVSATESTASSTIPPPRKKARITGRLNKPTSMPFQPSQVGNRAMKVKRPHVSHRGEHRLHVRPESRVDFTLPSWRGLSAWMGSLMSW